ncbi:MAG TPA: hypothetical protein PKE07_15335, partial [Lacibacter sp.]|nr:hypothetical protein [Lacibacter sp.]HMO90537.1 hypothetical protein [Lacibacter sp.]
MPYTQNFGTSTFTSMPTGMAAWNGVSGSTSTQASAEGSTPASDATITAQTAVTTTGGTFGYSTSSNGRVYIQTSSNATNGANQVALAINTTGFTNITVSYDVEIISAQPKTVGIVLQYRVGTSGSWITVTGTGNPYSQAGGTTGLKATPSLTLPAGANNQSVVQLRWATWRGTESGNSSGIAIDNISVNGTSGGGTPPSVTTSAATSIGTTSATLNGNVTDQGSASVTDRGFVYKTSSGVTISDNKTQSGAGAGTFTLGPTLAVNTRYYFRAYAINSVNTTLGAELDFWTLANTPTAPTVNNPTGSTLDVAIGGSDGNPAGTTYAIQETGGQYVQANGSLGASAVWQTSATWGTVTVTGLSGSTTYTFRVKARNGANVETAFGSTASETTSATPVVIARQDFETNPATPTMTFTTSDVGTNGSLTGFSTGTSGASDAPASANLFSEGSRGYRIQGSGSSTSSRSLIFNAVNTSSYSNIELSFRVAGMSIGSSGNGMDATIDEVLVDVSPDNGVTWYQQAKVVSGASNLKWWFGATGAGTRSYTSNNSFSSFTTSANVLPPSNASTAISTVTLTNLPAVSQLRVRITAQMNADNESWIIDDVRLIGIFAPIPSVTTTSAITSITDVSASSGGTGLSDNGEAITAKGVVWNTSPAPTVALSTKTNNGSGTADFTSNLTSLSPQTLYYVRAYATNANGTGYGPELQFRTLSTEPASHPTLSGTSTIFSEINLSFPAPNTINNCAGYVIIRRTSTTPGIPDPADGLEPNAITYGAGNTLVTVITNPAQTSFTVTGLSGSTTYGFRILPFNFDGTNAATYNYRTTGSTTATITTAAAPSSSSDIVTANGESATVSSIENTSTIANDGQGVQVWQFTIRDGGGSNDADNLPTILNSIRITKGTGNTVGNWQDIIQSAALFDGSTLVSNSPVLDPNYIEFTGLNVTVADNGSKTLSLRISLQTSITDPDNQDNNDFRFRILSGDVTTPVNNTSSLFSSFTPPVSVNDQNVFSVVSTELRFVQQPTNTTLNIAMTPAPTVQATDANGNRDRDRSALTVSITSSGTLGTSPQTATMTNGITGGFSTIQHTAGGNGLQLTASLAGHTAAISSPFNIIANNVGDFRSNKSNGNWETPADWDVWDGTNWNVSSIIPNDATKNVTIQTGHTYVFTVSSRSLANLTIEAGARLWRSSSTNTFFNVFGNVVCDGILGGPNDGLGLNMDGINVTISGTGTFDILRLRKNSTTNTTTNLVIDADVNLWFDRTALYNAVASTFNITINEGRTVELKNPGGDVSLDNTSPTSTDAGGSILINGTLIVPDTLYAHNTGTGNNRPTSFIVSSTGTLRVGNLRIAASVPPNTFTVQAGGRLELTGTNGISAFSTSNNTITLEPGSIVEYRAAGNQSVLANAAFPYSQLIISGTGVKTVATGTGSVSSSVILNNGASLTVASGASLGLGGAATAVLEPNARLTVGGTVDFNGRPVTLRSTSAGTASIGQISGTLTGATNVTVERYIPAARKWRAISTPLSSATAGNTIFNSWQNNGAVIAGQGMLLWSPDGTGASGNGYSQNTAGGATTNIRGYNNGSGSSSTNGSFNIPSSSTGTNLFAGGRPVPYLVFATDHYKTGTNVGNMTGGASATTLRATGTLYQGGFSNTDLAAGFHFIPNPYPSAIDY